MAELTARQRVLAFIRRRKTATATQIGHGLNMSVPAVRHHLGILVTDGRLNVEKTPGKTKRGRPEKTYRLSDRMLGDNLGWLADSALKIWFEQIGNDEQELAVRRLAETLRDQLGQIGPGLPAAKRLVQVTQRLTSLNYEAAWEAGAQGPRIVFGHCPYASIIARHPELCRMDADLLSLQMDAQAQQVLKMDQKPGGAQHCVFIIRPQRAKSTTQA